MYGSGNFSIVPGTTLARTRYSVCMNISTGDFHLKDYARCKGCKRTATWKEVKELGWGTVQSSMFLGPFEIPGFKKYFCQACFRQATRLWWWRP